MYIGTLDKKLLVLDETKEEVVDQIALEAFRESRVSQPIIRSSTSSRRKWCWRW